MIPLAGSWQEDIRHRISGSYLPTAASPEYHASKACVRVYGESLRVLLRGTGVDVTVICPGFVSSGRGFGGRLLDLL